MGALGAFAESQAAEKSDTLLEAYEYKDETSYSIDFKVSADPTKNYKVVGAKVLKRLNDKLNGVDEVGCSGGKSEKGWAILDDGSRVRVTIDNEKIMRNHDIAEPFALNVTTPAAKRSNRNRDDSSDEEDDDQGKETDEYEDYDFNPQEDGITPLSTINGTSITIADVLRRDEKILINRSTYTKKCDHENHCFVAKCKHSDFEDSRRRACTIYKNLQIKPVQQNKKDSDDWDFEFLQQK